jgi:tetratricopeptide (TPR) repeat protein
LTGVNGFGLLLATEAWYLRCCGLGGSVLSLGHGDPAGRRALGGRQSGGNRHTARTFALDCGARWRRGARCRVHRVACRAESEFINSIDPLFAGVLARPGNLDNTIQYAASAAAQGDIESAISTYEQLRFYNPKLGATRYQLDALYYQLGSYAQARGYLQTALQMRDVTPELRQKIEDLLALVDKKLLPDQFYGFAQTGLRYQTNASLGAGSQTVLASGGN